MGAGFNITTLIDISVAVSSPFEEPPYIHSSVVTTVVAHIPTTEPSMLHHQPD